jgi:hypothetical protein
MINLIGGIFHKCKMETTNIPHSNSRGEIWIQKCKCGKEQEVLFNHKGNCLRIKPIKI